MPRNLTTLQIFLASPSDVIPERDSVRAVVNELNSALSRAPGIRLEVFGWETNVYPAFSTDPQAVINEQSPDDYDLFIAILWTRLGSATPRADSGTVEEFERALARFKRAPNSLQLMVFFKTEAVPPNELDPKQLAGIQDFHSRVSAQGGLAAEFKTTTELEQRLRLFLTQYVHDWEQRRARERPEDLQARSDPMPERSVAAKESDEPGFIDLVDEITESSARLVRVGSRMGAALTEFAGEIDVQTQEMKKAADDRTLGSVKRMTNGVAESMDRLVAIMAIELATFSANYEDTFTKAAQLASLALEFGDRPNTALQLIELSDAMNVLHTVFGGSAASTRGLRSVIGETPRMTTVYNRARKATMNMLDAVASELESASLSAAQTAKTIRSIAMSHRGEAPSEISVIGSPGLEV